MKPEAKRLSVEEWREIKKLLKKPNRNITKIARDYKINRGSIYAYALRNGWVEKKKTPQTLWGRIKGYFTHREAT